MNPNVDPLAQLRDLHTPDPISFWPPAFGWWMIVVFILVLVAVALWGIRYRKRTAPRREALAELIAAKAEYDQTQDSTNLMKSLSQLLRRYAMVCFGRQNVAGLTGMSWLKFLDEQGKTTQFSSEVGHQAFVAIPYGSDGSVNAYEMVVVVERWIKSIPLPSRRQS